MILLLYLLELATLFLVCKNVLHLRKTRSLGKLAVTFFVVIFWAFYIIFSQNTFPNTIALLIAVLLFYTEHWYFKCCLVVVYTLFVNIVSNLNIYLYCMIAQNDSVKNMNYYLYSDILVLLFIILTSFIIKKYISFPTEPFRYLSGKSCFLILFVAIIDFFLSSVTSLLFYDTLNLVGKYLLIMCIVITILVSILLLILYFRIKHYHSLLKERETINQKMLLLEEKHYKEMLKKNEDLRAFRHDYNFHITAMQGFVAKLDLRGLKNYVEHLSGIKEQMYYISTNNSVCDAIVNYFYENLDKNIEFKCDGKFPESIFVNDSDLCVVFSNLLKNAVEAVAKEDKENYPKIYIFLYANAEYLSIIIENTCTYLNNTIQTLPTTKMDSQNHGFGLKNIRDIVKKYNGNLELTCEKNIFKATCYLRNI